MRYSIEGEPFPVVICEVEEGESMMCEAGAMSWMSPNMKMETSSGGGVGKMFGRALSHEHLFMNRYTAERGNGQIAFTSCFPGCIRKLDIRPREEMIVQKSAYLASTEGVQLSVFFQKKFGTGIFGGEGFIMQKLSGEGTAFVELDGYVKEYDLEAGQEIIIDTGYLAAMTGGCTMDIKSVPGVKNALFGGEGVFNTVVKGPGQVWLQSMPIYQLADAVRPFLPTNEK